MEQRLMSALRKVATKLMRAVLRHSAAESHDWASAMLRELDFIESDWAALVWAFGGVTALFRRSSRRLCSLLMNRLGHEEGWMNDLRKRAVGIVSGVGIAAALAVCAFSLLYLASHFLPFADPERMPRLAWLIVITLPEVSFIFAAIALWRKRRSMAVGVLLSAIVLATHFAIHLATHGL
jgi:hypothetical protein